MKLTRRRGSETDRWFFFMVPWLLVVAGLVVITMVLRAVSMVFFQYSLGVTIIVSALTLPIVAGWLISLFSGGRDRGIRG